MSSASEDMLSSQCWLHQALSLVHSVDAQHRHGRGGVQPRAGRAVAFHAQTVLPAGRCELAGWQVVFHVASPLGVAAFRRLRHCFVGWCPLLRWSCWRATSTPNRAVPPAAEFPEVVPKLWRKGSGHVCLCVASLS